MKHNLEVTELFGMNKVISVSSSSLKGLVSDFLNSLTVEIYQFKSFYCYFLFLDHFHNRIRKPDTNSLTFKSY